MKLGLVLKSINNHSVESLRKSIRFSLSEAPSYINALKATNKELIYQKITNLNNWYTKIIGLDEVKLYQDRVSSLQVFIKFLRDVIYVKCFFAFYRNNY